MTLLAGSVAKGYPSVAGYAYRRVDGKVVVSELFRRKEIAQLYLGKAFYFSLLESEDEVG